MAEEKKVEFNDIDLIIKHGLSQNASDIHIGDCDETSYLSLRINGELIKQDNITIAKNAMSHFQDGLMNRDEKKIFDGRGSYDVSYQSADLCRSRLHFFKFKGGTGINCRLIPFIPKSMSELRIPLIVNEWAKQKGLVLVSGLANQGKTTTMASVVHEINKKNRTRIVILEDPTEFIHINDQAEIIQREIPKDSPSYADALMDIFREDTDMVFLGEARSTEVMDTAMSLAEAGMNVFVTVHAKNVVETIEKVVNLFPSEHYKRTFTRLSWILSGIICQKLLPTRRGGRVLCAEYLDIKGAEGADGVEGALKKSIKEGDTNNIKQWLSGAGSKKGSSSFEISENKLRSEGLLIS